MLQAQAPAIEWQRCLGGSLYEESWGVQATADGGCAVLGSTASYDGDVSGQHGPPDFWLVKLDAMGQIQWQRCYGGSDADVATRLLATSDGGFLMLGSTTSADGDIECNGFFSHAWALKVDSIGNVQWQTCLAGDLDGSGADIDQAVETADGGYLAVGGTFANEGIWQENHGQSDYFAAKLDGGGVVEWLHCYGGSGQDEAWAIKATPEGDHVIAGTSASTDGQVTTGSTGQVWVIKIDTEGNLLWNRRMGGSGGPNMDDSAKDLLVNPDGSILVVGFTASNDGDVSGNHGNYDVWLVLLDSSGTIQQQRCFGGTGEDQAWSGAVAGQGRFVVAGYTKSNDGDVSGNHGGNGLDAWVLMVDADLDLLWQKCLGGSGGDDAYAVARNPAGEIFTSGKTYSTDGDVSGLHSPGIQDIWLVKLFSDLDAGVGELLGAGQLSTYPSPATDRVNVVLPTYMQERATLEVLDITGRIVLQRPVEPGMRSLQIAVEGWANGVYCLELRTGAGTVIGRFVKQ